MLSVNDFFSGCGGLSQGFKEAGFKIQVAVDKEEAFLKTFSHNFKDSQTKNLDLGDSNTLKDIPKSDILLRSSLPRIFLLDQEILMIQEINYIYQFLKL